MEKNNVALIVVSILIITLIIYYYTNNTVAQPLYIKLLQIFTILYSSLYLCLLYVPDLINNKKAIYGGDDLNSMKYETDIPDIGNAYYSKIALIIVDKNRNFALLKKDNKYEFPKQPVSNIINSFDKVKELYKDFTGKPFNENNVASFKTQFIQRADKNDVQYYIFVLKTPLTESEKLVLKNREFIVNEVYNAKNTKNLINTDTYTDLLELFNLTI